MNPFTGQMPFVLYGAAALQLGVAVLNLFLFRILRWKNELARMPLLLSEVIQVHTWFISITLAIFGVLTWRFALQMASKTDPICRWLAACIAFFWGARTILQVTYYSSSHWRGKRGRTFIHGLCLMIYGSLALIYLWAAMGL